MALVRDVDADDELHVIPLYREQPVVVAPKDHPVTAFETVAIGDLGDETILDGQGADTVELVAANVGLALMPQSVARAHSRRDVVARPVTGVPDTGIGLAWLRCERGPPHPGLHRDRARAHRELVALIYASSSSSSRGKRGLGDDRDPVVARLARFAAGRVRVGGDQQPGALGDGVAQLEARGDEFALPVAAGAVQLPRQHDDIAGHEREAAGRRVRMTAVRT